MGSEILLLSKLAQKNVYLLDFCQKYVNIKTLQVPVFIWRAGLVLKGRSICKSGNPKFGTTRIF